MATGSSEVASPSTRLDEKDLPELLRVLHPARIEYNSFGLQIGVGVGEIACIEQTHKDPRHCLREILTASLKKSEPLTWNDIVAALREECVGLGKIADDIREKYAHLFTPTISMASKYEHRKRFDKVIREADSEEDEIETCRQRHESICEQGSDEEVGGREKRTQSLRKRESKHEMKSKGILKQKEYASIKKTGGDHRARVSKGGERSSEYEGIETVRSKKHVQEVDSEDSVLSRKKKELSNKGKGKGGKPAHDKGKQVHGKERVNKKEKFMKDESHSEPEEVREKRKKATHDREESVSDHNHYSDSEVCRKRVKGSRKREVDIESESEASSDEEEMQRSSLEDDTSHKESAKRKPVTKHTEMKVKVQKEHREHQKNKKDAKSQYSDEEVSTKSAQKLRRSKKFETESDEESSSASSSDEEEIEVLKHTKHTETKSVAHTKDMTHYEKGKTSGKKRVSLKLQSTTTVSPCPELYKDKRGKKAVKVGKSIDSSKETYHKTSSKPPRNQREDQEEKVVSGKKGSAAPPLERDLPSSEMAETDSGDGESDESSEDENESEQKSSDEEEETEKDDGSSVKEKGSEKSNSTLTTTEMRKTKSQDDDENSKQNKSSKALLKDDSHGDKEGSDPGGSRDQEDQPKKRNRRRHRESSKRPTVRGGSSPSSSQEERKPGSRRQRRTPKHGGKYKRKEKKKRRETLPSSFDTDSSSPTSEMLTKLEKKKLKKVFKHSFGQLCCASFNPVETAVQLQKKGLISSGMMMDIIRSPESQQEKIIRLVCGLDNRVRSRPERLFGCIEVLLENDALQVVGRDMLRETGNPIHTSNTGCVRNVHFLIFAGIICPDRTAAKFPRATPSSESAALSEVVGR